MEEDTGIRPAADHVGDVETGCIPDSSDMPASARVFGIGELIERILIELAEQQERQNRAQDIPLQPAKKLFVLQRVSRKVALAIKESKQLRRHMFLEPPSVLPEVVEDFWGVFSHWPESQYLVDPFDWLFYERGIVCRVKRTFLKPIPGYDEDPTVWYQLGCGQPNGAWGGNESYAPTRQHSAVANSTEAFLRSEASWRQISLFNNTSALKVRVTYWGGGQYQHQTFFKEDGASLGHFYDTHVQIMEFRKRRFVRDQQLHHRVLSWMWKLPGAMWRALNQRWAWR